MEQFAQVLLAVLRIVVIPALGYTIVRLARRWPLATLAILLLLDAGGAAAVAYAAHEGYSVDRQTRQMEFGSPSARWCFGVGGLLLILGIPALPLVAVARTPNGADMGPGGGQWFAVLFCYFLACAIFGMVLFSLLTGIVK